MSRIRFREVVQRPETIVSAIVMAFAVIGWEQWAHSALFETHSGEEGSLIAHWMRDSLLTVVPALLALGGGLWIADRLGTPRTPVGALVSQTVSISVVFGLLLIPMVALHSAIDGFLGGHGGLGSLRVAPGAGYVEALAQAGLEGATGFFGVAAHGARDALLAEIALIPLAFVCVAAMTAYAQADTTRSVVPAVQPARRVASSHAPAATLSRRDLLKYGSVGTVAFVLSAAGTLILPKRPAHAAEPSEVTPWLIDDIELFINDGIVEMIDHTPVYMWGYGFNSGDVRDAAGLHTPGPVIWTHEGETVTMSVTNNLDEDHSFVIDGVYDSGPIAPGATVAVSFDSPAAGTYLYKDALNAPVNRVLGLQGVMIVMPADNSLRLSGALDADYWTFHTQWVWLFNEIDPSFNARAHAGLAVSAADFKRTFLPRYFTINGRMGSLASHVETAPDTAIHDHQGNSALIRIVNGGYASHGPHIHGNHVYVLSTDARLLDTIMWKDTILVKPEQRKDVYLPFNIPPNAVRWPPDPAGVEFLAELHGRDIEGAWPMHCHIEMSQTAGGGLYPQGLLTDWTMEP